MTFRLKKAALALAVPAVLFASCVKVNTELGKDLLDKSMLYDTYTVEFPLTDVQMRHAEKLSGYSDTRITIGAIRDEVFGLTTRESAFTLIPDRDTIYLGENPEPVKFDIHFAPDTISTAMDGQEHILQNIYVYELLDTLGRTNTSTTRDIPHSDKRITRGIPVYNGSDSLSFEFSREFAQKYIDAIVSLGGSDHIIPSYKDYVCALPGIFIQTDIPEGIGGRINMFDLSCLSISNDRYVRNGNVGLLTIRSTYDGVRKDTTFMFVPGEPDFYNEVDLLKDNQYFYQYAFNHTTHETSERPAKDVLYVEGGGGLKPVISAREIQRKTVEAIRSRGGDPAKAVIGKATIVLPLSPVDVEFKDLAFYPSVLSPTVCMEFDEGNVQFAGLSDASASNENQGDLDRSNLAYTPDITYHLQEILREEVDETHDIWLLTVHTEVIETANGSSADDEYYRQMMYAMYYNNLYGGGYGYGGYGYGGGYGYNNYGYSNYYNYWMLAQMMANSNKTTVSTTQALDKDRYYRAVLNGPEAGEDVPRFRVTFSVPKE